MNEVTRRRQKSEKDLVFAFLQINSFDPWRMSEGAGDDFVSLDLLVLESSRARLLEFFEIY